MLDIMRQRYDRKSWSDANHLFGECEHHMHKVRLICIIKNHTVAAQATSTRPIPCEAILTHVTLLSTKVWGPEFCCLGKPIILLGSFWAAFGQLLGSLWATFGQSLGKFWATSGQLPVVIRWVKPCSMQLTQYSRQYILGDMQQPARYAICNMQHIYLAYVCTCRNMYCCCTGSHTYGWIRLCTPTAYCNVHLFGQAYE